MLIIHIGLIVLMAIRAAKYGVVSGIGMTIRASIPFAIMLARINGEVQNIVLEKIGRFPARNRGMAGTAIG